MKTVTRNILLIVPCSRRKIWDSNPLQGPTPARDAYTSTYFRLCKSYAESRDLEWVILSAKYGLVLPDYLIESNYDVSFKDSNKHSVPIERVIEQMQTLGISRFKTILSFCGRAYNNMLEVSLAKFGKTLINPFPEDMRSIGLRQRYVKSLIEGNDVSSCQGRLLRDGPSPVKPKKPF